VDWRNQRRRLCLHYFVSTIKTDIIESLPSIVCRYGCILLRCADEPDSDHGTEKPANSTDETKGFAGSPPIAYSIMSDPPPAECTTAAVVVIEKVDEETERSEPGGGEDKARWPGKKASREWTEPHQAEEDRDAGNDFDIDEAFLGPCAGFVERV
jgi:hypothetical protein